MKFSWYQKHDYNLIEILVVVPVSYFQLTSFSISYFQITFVYIIIQTETSVAIMYSMLKQTTVFSVPYIWYTCFYHRFIRIHNATVYFLHLGGDQSNITNFVYLFVMKLHSQKNIRAFIVHFRFFICVVIYGSVQQKNVAKTIFSRVERACLK